VTTARAVERSLTQDPRTLDDMNAERLHAVARAIKDELESLSVVAHLDALVAGLQGLTSQPADAAAQQQLSDARTALQRLATAPSNSWPASDQQVADELGLRGVLGEELLQRIEGVLARNEMTPAVAVSEITPIAEEARQASAQLTALVAALAFFEIGADEPAGDAEIIFTIPRDAVHEELHELGEEFTELWRILAPFQELVTGNRGGIPVETISSSAFGLELLAVPAFAYGVARAVNEILNVYKNILDIRVARQHLKDSGVPDDALAGVDDHANQAMARRNEALAEELVAELPVADSIDDGRRNELTIEIRLSLNAIANRLDKGYDIDVRAPEPPAEADEDGDEDGEPPTPGELADFELQRQIREISPRLMAERPAGASILSLPESTEDDASAEQKPRRRAN